MVVTYGTALQTSAVPFGVLRAHAGSQVCRPAGFFELGRRFGCVQGTAHHRGRRGTGVSQRVLDVDLWG